MRVAFDAINEPRYEKTCFRATRYELHQPAQLHKLAKVMKLQIKKL